MSGFMLIFMAVMKELDLLVILISPNTQTLPYMAYSLHVGGNGSSSPTWWRLSCLWSYL